jgi:hypothetical protein
MGTRVDFFAFADLPGTKLVDSAETHPPHPRPFSRAGEKGAEAPINLVLPWRRRQAARYLGAWTGRHFAQAIKSAKRYLIAAAMVAIFLALPLAAQSGRGVITGVVTDSSGGTVSGAEVVVTNKANGVETRTVTTHSGVYRLPYLPPDLYRVSASAQGFKTAVKENVEVFLTQTVTANFTLEVGEVTESVTVSAESPLLEADTMEIGTNATLKEVQNWPIIVGDGTRQLQNFVFRAMPGTQGNEFAGAINGGQAFSHEILVDGISLGRMDLNGGSMNEFTPTMDAVNEFKLQTGALSSQYGSTQTAVVSFGLRSGSNQFHGSAFEFHLNSVLNANSWAANRQAIPKQPKVENNFGATLGGPIIKNRTHFFVSYEGDRFRDHTVTGEITVPLPEYKAGNFARLLDAAFTGNSLSGSVIGRRDALGREVRYGQIYDPATSRQLSDGTWIRDPFPGNIIPKERYSLVTSKILAKHDVPSPNRSTFRFNHPSTVQLATRDIDNLSVKIDHVLNSQHKVTASVVNNDRTRSAYGGAAMFGVPLPGPAMLGSRTQYTPGWIIRVSEDWTLGSNKLNHFAFGYNRFRNRNASAVFQERDWAAELGLQGVGGATFPQMFFAGNNATLNGNLGGVYGSSQNTDSPNGSVIIQDDFTWLRGSHSVKLGGEHRRYYFNGRKVISAGDYTFHSRGSSLPGFQDQTGFGYASFLLGAASSANLDLPFVTLGIRSRSTAFYLQDNWKFTPKLMLNLGVRWDIPQPLSEVANRMSSLDPHMPNPAAGGRPGALLFLGDCEGCTGRTSFADTYYRQFAPRVGFAYSAAEKVVVRAGYGINFSPPILDGFAFPYQAGFNGSNPIDEGSGRFFGDPIHYWDNPYPRYPLNLPDTNPSLLNGLDVAYYPPETQKMPYVQNWNLGIQYELPWQTRIEANYIGNKGTRLNEGKYRNQLNQVDPKFLSLGNTLLEDISLHPEIALPFPGFRGIVSQALKPFPQYRLVSAHRLNNGWSNYHSVQVTVTKRSSRGLSLLAAYTFSKALGTSDTTGPGDYSYNQQDIYNTRADYGVTSLNVPQDLKVSWIYDLPLGPQGRWGRSGVLSKVLGGWSASGIHRYRSGNALGIGIGDPGNLQALWNRIRPDVLLPRNQQIIGFKPDEIDVQKGTPYLNPAAFTDPPYTSQGVPVRLGNAPRFLPNLRGFAFYSEDFALTKRTPLGFREGTSLEIRIDAINVMNRIGLQNPVTSLFNQQNFGRIFGKTGDPRNVQIGVRLNF